MYEIDHARLIEMNVSRAQQASRDGGAIWETQESTDIHYPKIIYGSK